jgi:hypothetical protein
MPAVVEVPKITRTRVTGIKRGSKYVPVDEVEGAALLLRKHAGEAYIGELISPVDTIVKARIAAGRWKDALSEFMELPREAFSVRVFTLPDPDPKDPNVWTFAIAIKKGA